MGQPLRFRYRGTATTPGPMDTSHLSPLNLDLLQRLEMLSELCEDFPPSVVKAAAIQQLTLQL